MQHTSKLIAFACAGSMILASVGSSFAQTATSGGAGSTGNDNNNPAAIQGGASGTMKNNGTMMQNTGNMKDETGTVKNDNSGAVPKPGKECGQRGENQGTSQPDAKVGCE